MSEIHVDESKQTEWKFIAAEIAVAISSHVSGAKRLYSFTTENDDVRLDSLRSDVTRAELDYFSDEQLEEDGEKLAASRKAYEDAEKALQDAERELARTVLWRATQPSGGASYYLRVLMTGDGGTDSKLIVEADAWLPEGDGRDVSMEIGRFPIAEMPKAAQLVEKALPHLSNMSFYDIVEDLDNGGYQIHREVWRP